MYNLKLESFPDFVKKSDFELSQAYESISFIAYPSLNWVSQRNVTSGNFRFAEISKIFKMNTLGKLSGVTQGH